MTTAGNFLFITYHLDEELSHVSASHHLSIDPVGRDRPAQTVAADDPQPRTWKDATGTFSVVATLAGVADGKVQLKREDGTVVTVTLEQLSSADQQYIAALKTGSGDADSQGIAAADLTGKPQELQNDDGEAAGKKSFPRGIAVGIQGRWGRLLRHIDSHSWRSLRHATPTQRGFSRHAL